MIQRILNNLNSAAEALLYQSKEQMIFLLSCYPSWIVVLLQYLLWILLQKYILFPDLLFHHLAWHSFSQYPFLPVLLYVYLSWPQRIENYHVDSDGFHKYQLILYVITIPQTIYYNQKKIFWLTNVFNQIKVICLVQTSSRLCDRSTLRTAQALNDDTIYKYKYIHVYISSRRYIALCQLLLYHDCQIKQHHKD